MARTRVNSTKLEIIRVATNMFLEKGVTATTAKNISDELGISTGNLTFHFPTKEHILAELVELLCDFQGKMMELEAKEGVSSIMATCLEFATMAALCEEDEIAKDFYISTYKSPMCLAIIRKNDIRRAKQVFKEYCSDWSDERFEEAEILVSGIEYSTLMTSGVSVSLETRIAGAVENILSVYNVPDELRKVKIQKTLALDFRNLGKRVLKEFKEYVEEANEHAFKEKFGL